MLALMCATPPALRVTVPITTRTPLSARPTTHDAVVRTYRFEIIEPPQKCTSVSDLSEAIWETCPRLTATPPKSLPLTFLDWSTTTAETLLQCLTLFR